MSSALPSLYRPALRLIALALIFAPIPAAHAASITYDVALSPTTGQYGGSGTITLASEPARSGTSAFSAANGQLEGLTFTIDNQTFTLAGDPTATVEFLNGQLYNISFAQTLGSSPNRFTLDTSAVYAFYYNNGQSEAAGNMTATPTFISDDSGNGHSTSSSPTPEPTSLLLLATALLGGGFFVFRRMRAAHS